jgi:hypothetical protein
MIRPYYTFLFARMIRPSLFAGMIRPYYYTFLFAHMIRPSLFAGMIRPCYFLYTS